MKALLQTEWNMSYGKITLCVVLASGFLALFLPKMSMIGVHWGLMFLLAAAPLNAAQRRLKSRWNRYLLTMPYSRRQVVNARYLYYLAAALGGAVWMILLCTVMGIFRSTDLPDGFLLRSAVHSTGLTLLGLAVMLPLSLLMDRFEKQWLHGIGMMLLLPLFFGAFYYIILTVFEAVSSAFGTQKLGIVLLLLLPLSYGISLAAYCGGHKRKETSA